MMSLSEQRVMSGCWMMVLFSFAFADLSVFDSKWRMWVSIAMALMHGARWLTLMLERE